MDKRTYNFQGNIDNIVNYVHQSGTKMDLSIGSFDFGWMSNTYINHNGGTVALKLKADCYGDEPTKVTFEGKESKIEEIVIDLRNTGGIKLKEIEEKKI